MMIFSRSAWRFCFLLMAVVLATGATGADVHDKSSARTTAPSDDRANEQSRSPALSPLAEQAYSGIKVYLLTFGPGADPWEKFGHNAIWIHDPTAPPAMRDLAYNWGYFDFEQKNFYIRFVQGRMWYEMASDEVFTGPYARIGLLDYYGAGLKDASGRVVFPGLDRSIYRQELNLTTLQKLELRALLRQTDTDANRNYQYDYYRDNCSTRPRDVIDKYTGGALGAITKGMSSGKTYRWHTRRLTAQTPWLYTVLEAVMGHPVDRPISKWDEMFLPMELRDELRRVIVPDPAGSGRLVPLVAQELELYKSKEFFDPAAPPRAWPWFLLAGGLLALLYLALGHFVRRHWTARVGLIVTIVPWLLLMGIGGVIILWGWLGTDHLVAKENENLLQVSPLMLPMAVLLPLLIKGGRRRGRPEAARWLAVVAAGGALIGLLLKATPWFYQYNWDIVALALPVNVAIAFITWKLADGMLTVPDRAKGEAQI